MLVPDQLRALVVDDNAYARAGAAASLRKLGLKHVVETPTAPEALLTLMAEPFDLLLMDWYMPDMNGASLLRILRDPRFGKHGRLATLMMTAYPSKEVFGQARELGISDVLAKPIETAQLAALIQKHLGGWSLPEEDEIKTGTDAFLI